MIESKTEPCHACENTPERHCPYCSNTRRRDVAQGSWMNEAAEKMHSPKAPLFSTNEPMNELPATMTGTE